MIAEGPISSEPSSWYRRVDRIEDALDVLDTPAPPEILAGGTDLVLMRSARGDAQRHDTLLDVKPVPELAELDDLGIGATVTMARLARVQEPWLGAVADGAVAVGGPQTRARATVGGNVCRASPSGDTLPALLSLSASAVLRSRQSGERRVPLPEFFAGPGQHTGRSDELLCRIELGRRTGASAYQRFTHRRFMDLAVAGVAVWLELRPDGRCGDAAVSIGSVGPVPALVPEAGMALVDTTLDAQATAAAGAILAAAASPIDDVRGTASFRRRVLLPLLRRACATAVRRSVGAQS